MIKKLFILFLILFSVSVIADTAPTNKLYQVNLIVFSHITSDALHSENWPNQLLTPDLRGSINLFTQSTVGSYQLLPEKQSGLSKELNQLKGNSDYHILLARSWVQPMPSLKYAKWIQIYAGQPYDKAGQPMNDHTPLQIAENQENAAFPDMLQEKPAYWELNGKIKVGFQTFYQAYLQLYLTEPESIIGGPANSDTIVNFQTIPLQTFYLQENRHTRLNEVNYIDHPLFGAIINITPYYKTETPATSTPIFE